MAIRRTISVLVIGVLQALLANWLAHTVRAQSTPAPAGIAAGGLCGLIYAETPTCPAYLLAVSGTAGYGHTESMGSIKGSHKRFAGTLGVGFAPFDWLAVSARLDGRLDIHPPDPDGPDGTMVGDPRIAVRMGRALNQDFSFGGSIGLWMPGADAPSLRFTAASVDFKALGAWRPHQGPWSLLGTVGFRLDQSGSAAPDLRRLRPGDRLSLGLSDYHAVLGVLGVSYTFVGKGEVFAELSGDILVGAKAPSLMKSPLRAGIGGRYFLSKMLQVEVSVTGSLSQRPSLAESAKLVPVEPRVYATTGIRFGLPSPERRVSGSGETDPEPADVPSPNQEIELAASPQIALVTGSILDAEGAPLPEAQLTLTAGEQKLETFTDGNGVYSFDKIPLGPVSLAVSAAGFSSQTWEITAVYGMSSLGPRSLVQASETGILRCLTRTFGSDGLKANIVVRDAKGKEVAKGESDATGRFEIKIQPGSYQVIITASGYRSHRRQVKVDSNGVAILNVDMREQ